MLGDNSQGLWHKLWMDKYSFIDTGWLVPNVYYRASGMWKSILSVTDDFDNCIQYQVCNGNKLGFWNDLWCGNMLLEELSPALYMLDRCPEAVVDDNFQIVGDSVIWIVNFAGTYSIVK